MSIAEIIKEIPKLNAVERHALLLEIKKQEQIEASKLFAKAFEGITEIEIQTPLDDYQAADALAKFLKKTSMQ